MTELKRTRGPWQHVSETYGDFIEQTNNSGRIVFRTNEHGRPTKADGALMAAAPDLLEACLNAQNILTLFGDDSGTLEQVLAAIAKATTS